MTEFQRTALAVLEKHYGDEFDSALIFPLEALLSGADRGDTWAVEFGLEKLEMCTRLLAIKPLLLPDILDLH